MADALRRHRRERGFSGAPSLSELDIDVRAYEVCYSLERGSHRTWGKILPAIIAERDKLSSAGRRVLLRTIRRAAKKLRNDADRAEQRARRYDELIAELDDPKQAERG
jgi:hypothetical protein